MTSITNFIRNPRWVSAVVNTDFYAGANAGTVTVSSADLPDPSTNVTGGALVFSRQALATDSAYVVLPWNEGVPGLPFNVVFDDPSALHSIGVWVKGPATRSVDIEAILLNASASFVGFNGLGGDTLTGSWQRITATFTPTSLNAACIAIAPQIHLTTTNEQIGDELRTAGWSVTEGAADYFDGETPDGGGFAYDWLGATNASYSTRTEIPPAPAPDRSLNVRTNALLRR